MALEKIGLEALFKDDAFQAGINRYQQGVSRASHVTDAGASAMTRLGSVASGALVVGIGAGIAALGAFAAAAKIGLDAALARGEELDQLGDMFGLNAKQADVWATAMSHFKVPVAEGAQQLNFFTRGLSETVKVGTDGKKTLTPFGEALKKLGVSAFDARGKLRTFDQVMPQIMDRFAKLPAGIEKSRLAMELFGTRGGSKFLDFLSAGSKGLADATKRIDQFGGMTDEQVGALEEFGFALGDVQDNLKKIWAQVGLAVLPVLRRFVDFINQKILPTFGRWIKDIMPRVNKFLDVFVGLIQDIVDEGGDLGVFADDLRELFGVDISPLVNAFRTLSAWINKGVLPAMQRLIDAFRHGGLSGLFVQIATEIQNAIPVVLTTLQSLGSQFWNWLTGKGGALEQASAKLGQISAKIQDWLKANGPMIAAKFDELKMNFWNWLTGKGGALEQVGAKVSQIADALAIELQNRWPTIESALKQWAFSFWTWLTDSRSGVIVTVAENMEKLATALEDWSKDPKTKEWMQDIGERLANDILDGMGRLFDSRDESESLLQRLFRALWNAANSLAATFANLGGNIASGIVRGVAERFVSAEAAQAMANAIGSGVSNAIQILIGPGGPIYNLGRVLASALWNSFQSVWAGLFSSWNPSSGSSGMGGQPTAASTPVPVNNNYISPNPGAIYGFAKGGWVPRDMLALVHAGEYVVPAPQVNNSRVTNLNFSHTWPAAVPNSARAWTESMVRQVTQQEIKRVLGAV